jgi:general stress protein CsbA
MMIDILELKRIFTGRALAEANTFVQIQGVSMTIIAIFAGAVMGYLQRYKVIFKDVYYTHMLMAVLDRLF